jgi:hypothetical protein
MLYMIVLLNFYYAAKPADAATKKCYEKTAGAKSFYGIEIRPVVSTAIIA